MKLYNKIACLLIVLLLFSCSGNGSKEISDVKQITIDVEKNVKLFDCASILDTSYCSIIPLETTENSLIGEVTRVFFRGDKIYVFDKKTKSVFIFHEDGSYDSKIQSIGRSSNEYIDISDVFVSSNEIFILDNFLMKILCYSMNGDFIKKIDISDLWAQSLFSINGDIFLINKWSETKGGLNRLFVLNKNGEILHKFLPFDKEDTNRRGGQNICYAVFENNANICYMSDNNIYEITENKCVPKYTVDFLDKTMNQEDSRKNLMEMLKLGLDKKYVLGIESMQESSKYIFLSFIFNNIDYKAVYNKVTDETIVCQTIINSTLDKLGLSKFFIENDEIYSVYPANNLIASYNYVLKDVYDKDDKYGIAIKNLVSDLTEMSNDVIIRYKLKGNENQ